MRNKNRPRIRVLGVALLVGAAVAWAAFPHDRKAATVGRRVSGATHVLPPAGTSPAPGGESAAVAAAVADATASRDWLSMDDAAVSRAVAALSAPGASDALATETVAQMRSARQALSASPGPVWWVVAPLAVRVSRFNTTSASVDVWVVNVLSAPGVVDPEAGFSRVTVGLELVGGAWKLDAIDQAPGPAPALALAQRPYSAAELESVLDGYAPLPRGGH